MMKILFMGTPDFAVPCLEAMINAGYDVCGVVTQPDKPKGRGKKMTPPPVKVCAEANGIEVFQPTTVKNGELLPVLNGLCPDIIIVTAYGKLLPEYILTFPKYGCINIHASLLPRHRGASPITEAIISGDSVTGVTSMYMALAMDTGDMLLFRECHIEENDNFGTLHDKLAILGADVLLSTLKEVEKGTLSPIPQDDSLSTYAHMLTNENTVIDFYKDTRRVFNFIRGLSPLPCAYCFMGGKKMKILSCRMSDTKCGKPGEICKSGADILIGTADGSLIIDEIIAEGGKKMSMKDYINGHREILGTVAEKL